MSENPYDQGSSNPPTPPYQPYSPVPPAQPTPPPYDPYAPPPQPGTPYGQPAQGAPYGTQPGYGPQPGYGSQPGYGAPPQQGAPYGTQPGYGPQPGYGAPPQPGAPYGTQVPAQPYGYPPAPGQPYTQGDQVNFGAPADPTLTAAAPASKRKRTVLIAAALSVVLVAGAAVAGAWIWNGWGATQPESVLPGSSFGFARIDFSPGLGQQLKVKSLAEKFPKSADDNKEPVDQLTDGLLDGLGLRPLKAQDVRPWFNGRLGAAIWSESGSMEGACILFAIASKDEAKATTALNKVKDEKPQGSFAFAFNDGYAITADCDGKDTQASLDTALAETKKESLADHPSFKKSLDALPSGQLAVAYLDLSAFAELYASMLRGSAVDPEALKAVKGQALFGLQIADNSVELRMRVDVPGEIAADTYDAMKKLVTIPAGSAIGLSIDLSAAAKTNPGLGDALAPLIGKELAGSPSDCLNQATTQQEYDDCTSGYAEPVAKAIDAIFKAPLTAAIGTFEPPTFSITSHTKTSADATAITDVLKLLGLDELIKSSGEGVTVASEDFQGGSGTYGDSARFKETMDGAPENSIVAFYVDVEKIVASADLSSTEEANIKPVKSVGGAIGYEGNTGVALFRVIVE